MSQKKMRIFSFFHIIVIPLLIITISLSFCNGENEDEDDGSSDGNPGVTSAEMVPNSELQSATFVSLDYSAFPSPPSQGLPDSGVIYVSKSGSDGSGDGSRDNPFNSIRTAMSHAQKGSIIAIYGGTYNESSEDGDYRAVVITQENIMITNVEGETVTIAPKDEGVNYGIYIDASGSVIRGLNIDGFEQGILYNDKTISNSVVMDCVISHSSEGIATWDGTLNNLLILNVTISDAELIGLHCGNGYGNNWRVENCSISMKSNSENSGADCFAVEHGDNILLVHSNFTGASADGIDTKATRVVVYGCIVHNVGRNGIKLWHGGDIINSLVHHTGADASIVVEWGPRVRIINSTVGYHNYNGELSYNMSFGYDSGDGIDVDFVNSIFFNTSGGAYITGAASLNIDHCLFYNMENGNILEYGNILVTISQGANGLSVFGSGNIVADPLMGGDFHLSASSPAVNTGIKLSEFFPLKDMLGEPRVKGDNPDLGPFEDH